MATDGYKSSPTPTAMAMIRNTVRRCFFNQIFKLSCSFFRSDCLYTASGFIQSLYTYLYLRYLCKDCKLPLLSISPFAKASPWESGMRRTPIRDGSVAFEIVVNKRQLISQPFFCVQPAGCRHQLRAVRPGCRRSLYRFHLWTAESNLPG